MSNVKISELPVSTLPILGTSELPMVQNGVTVKASVNELRDFISVTAFGAVGDGVADDTAAVVACDAAATNNEKLVYFPSGTYIISSEIQLNSLGWCGESAKTTIIKSANITFTNLQAIVKTTNNNDFSISNLTFSFGNANLPGGSVLYVMFQATNCSNWTLNNCIFDGIKDKTLGLSVSAGTGFTISNNYFVNYTPTGAQNQAVNISLASGNVINYKIQNNIMNGSAIFASGLNGIISNNIIYNWVFGSGVTVGPDSYTSNTIIKNNVCYDSTGVDENGFYASGIEAWGNFNIITENKCYNNSGAGISVSGLYCIVTNNYSYNNSTVDTERSGIELPSIYIAGQLLYSNPSFCIISGNSCYDNRVTKLQKYGCVEYVVAPGQTITNNTYSSNIFSPNLTGTTNIIGEKCSFDGPNLMVTVNINPGLVSANSTLQVVVSVPGAFYSDLASATYDNIPLGIVLNTKINAPNTVTLIFVNVTSAGITIPSGTAVVSAKKHQNYVDY